MKLRTFLFVLLGCNALALLCGFVAGRAASLGARESALATFMRGFESGKELGVELCKSQHACPLSHREGPEDMRAYCYTEMGGRPSREEP